MLFFNFYNVGLVSAIQQCDSIIIIHYFYMYKIYTPLSPIPPPRSSQSARLFSLCYTATSHQPSVLHMIVYICWCYFLHLSHSLLPPQVHFLHLCLHSFPTNKFIDTIFLDSVWGVCVRVCVCVCLSSSVMFDSLWSHGPRNLLSMEFSR